MSPVSDLNSGRPLVEQLPPKAPHSRLAPCDADLPVGPATEVAALAALLAEVVQLAGQAAWFPGDGKALAKQAMERASVRAALLAARDAP